MIQAVVADQKLENGLVAGELPGHCQGSLEQVIKPQMLIRAAYTLTPSPSSILLIFTHCGINTNISCASFSSSNHSNC